VRGILAKSWAKMIYAHSPCVWLHKFQNIFFPLLSLPIAPLQPYQSSLDCLCVLHYSGGELESFSKLMVDLILWNEI